MAIVAKVADARKDSLYCEAREALKGIYRRTDFNAIHWDDNEADEFRERYQISMEEYRQLSLEAKPEPRCWDRRKWRLAINRRRFSSCPLGVAIALYDYANDKTGGYCWPSQERLAKDCGFRTEREVRTGLSALVKAGAIRSLPVSQLPPDLVGVAMGDVSKGGSGRSHRGTAYALVDPEDWETGHR